MVKMELLIKEKTCFTCKKKYPNFVFPINGMKYQRPDDLGTCRVCKFCTYKQWSKDMYTWVYNFKFRKFEKIEFKSKWEIIKKLIMS
jgi:hypothetical protein